MLPENDRIFNFNILVLEDDIGLSKLIKRKLISLVPSIHYCHNTADAFEYLHKQQNTLVLLDYRLPEMTADSVIAEFNNIREKIPFIIMTGYGDEKIAVEMMKLGARDYLIKDTNFLDLLPSAIARVMQELETEERLNQAEEALKRTERAFYYISEGTAPVTGDAFFFSLTRRLAQALDMKYAIVTRSADSPATKVNSYAFWNGEACDRELNFALKGTPCEQVYNGELTIIERDVIKKYPDASILKSLKADSYIGIPLREYTGEILGHLAVFDTKEAVDTESKIRLLKIFASRAAAELERIISDEEKILLEEQLFHAQKMESIGRLAGGIAHDFNNILTSIMGYSELLKLQFDSSDSPEAQAADIILKGTERAAELTRQLLGFARKGKYNVQSVDLNKAVREIVNVSEKIFEKNIEVYFELSSGLKNVDVDTNQFDQAVTNILINAKDAMPNGGRINIITDNVYLSSEFTENLSDVAPGHYVRLSFQDTGIGMTKAVLERLFEPFFTTKGEGKGTGLGMASVYGIVKNHKGHIAVTSESGKGTQINLYFAVSRDCISIKKRKQVLKSGEGTVLFVDDEKELREMAYSMLSTMGYHVFLAANGKEAINCYKSNSDSIDLVVLDTNLQEMKGNSVIYRLKEIDADVRVILSGGKGKRYYGDYYSENGIRGYLKKPFRLQEFSNTIKKHVRKTMI